MLAGGTAQGIQLSAAALHHAQFCHLPGGIQSPGTDGTGIYKASQFPLVWGQVQPCGLEKTGYKDKKFLPGEKLVGAERAILIALGKAGGVGLGGDGIVRVGEGGGLRQGNFLTGVALVGLHRQGAHLQPGDVFPEIVLFLQHCRDQVQRFHGVQLLLGPGAGGAVGIDARQEAHQECSQAENRKKPQ